MKLNLANFNEEALERRELRERKTIQQQRAIRQASHRSVRAAEPKPKYTCPDCGGDCKSMMADMQAVLKGGR
jgi:hypothetical protein